MYTVGHKNVLSFVFRITFIGKYGPILIIIISPFYSEMNRAKGWSKAYQYHITFNLLPHYLVKFE